MIDEKILNIIKESIPEQTAGVLKDYLAKADKNQKDLEVKNQKIAVFEDIVKERDETISKLKNDLKDAHSCIDGWLAKDQALTQREAMLFKNELEQKIFRLECQLDAKNIVVNRDLEIMQTVFRNPRFVQSKTTTQDVPVVIPRAEDKYGGYSRGADVEHAYGSTTVKTEEMEE